MQILFVHPNYPAQFGPLLSRLRSKQDVECVFVSNRAAGFVDGVRCIRARPRGGATRTTHYCSRTFENAVWNAHAVHEACSDAADLEPDLIVGHSGFGSTVFLKELYDCPLINYFEYYYRAHESDMDFREEFPPQPIDFLRSYTRNAMILLDLDVCTAAYTPSAWQHSLFPRVWQSKIEIIPDGIDTDFWRRRPVARRLGGEAISDDVRVVTYVARGLEAMRGFDIFVRVANRIAREMSNVLFVVVGAATTSYGNDAHHINARTFREHVISTEQPDLRRFRFLGTVAPETLVEIFSLSDLHIYLTVPFVLSWSLLDALACECTVLASDTAPVRDVLRHEENGLLAGFFDVDTLVESALRVLASRDAYRALGVEGRRRVVEDHGLDRVFPRLWDFLTGVVARGRDRGGAVR